MNIGKRLVAILIDFVLFFGVAVSGLAVGAAAAGDGGSGLAWTVAAAVTVAFVVAQVVFVAVVGSSLGMWAVRLKLVRVDDGNPPGLASALGRAALSACLVFLPWAVAVLVSILVDPAGRGLVDKATGTRLTDKTRSVAFG